MVNKRSAESPDSEANCWIIFVLPEDEVVKKLAVNSKHWRRRSNFMMMASSALFCLGEDFVSSCAHFLI